MPTSSRPPPPVFGEDRIRRLRIVLGALAGTALLGLSLAGYTVIGLADEGGRSSPGIVLGGISAVLLAVSLPTWFMLPRSTPMVRRAAAGCGALALVAALPTAGLVLGFVWAVIGLAILFLSLGPDQE